MKFLKSNFLTIAAILLVIVFIIQSISMHTRKTQPQESASDPISRIDSEQALKVILDKAGSKIIALDLYADWCGPCRLLHPTLVSLSQKYKGTVEFYRVNVDQNPEISQSFGTNGIPFVVFIKNKQVVASIVGLNPPETYDKIILEASQK